MNIINHITVAELSLRIYGLSVRWPTVIVILMRIRTLFKAYIALRLHFLYYTLFFSLTIDHFQILKTDLVNKAWLR